MSTSEETTGRDGRAPETLLIIGNGFDIDLGLPTRYEDFLQSDEFGSLKGNLVRALKSEPSFPRWIDVEHFLGGYSLRTEKMNAAHHPAELLGAEFRELRMALSNYIHRISVMDSINRDSDAYLLLRNLFYEAPLFILTFNYTTLLEALHDEMISPYEFYAKWYHGRCDEDSIIFGVGDDTKHRNMHAFLRKSVGVADETNEPNDFRVSEYMEPVKRVVFFGHSLGPEDHSRFRNFFDQHTRALDAGARQEDRKRLDFYYYDDNSRDQLNEQLLELTNGRTQGLKENFDVRWIQTKAGRRYEEAKRSGQV